MNIPWVDKYRPHRITNIVHQPELMRTLENIIITGEMPHFLFYGPPGTGKTTTILALANELFGQNKIKERVLELNASDNRGIDIVRNEIITFAKTVVGNPDPKYKSPPFKILILDEADAMTQDAQAALRKVMEETSSITRFCIICNYVDRIIEPIISRCMQFRFIPISMDLMKKRLKLIAMKEKLELNDDIYDAIIYVVKGDLRKGIMLLQNIKYVRKMKTTLVTDDVYDLVGYFPKNRVAELLKECLISDANIFKISKKYYSMGYPIESLCAQISNYLLENEQLPNNIVVTDKQKAKIFVKIANICEKLNDNANELLQLIRLLAHLHCVVFYKDI